MSRKSLIDSASLTLFSHHKICSSSSILASSCSHCSLKWEDEPLRRQFNDYKHVAQVIKQMSGFNHSLNIWVLILSSQFWGSCLHRNSVMNCSKVSVMSLFLFEAIQLHINVSLKAGSICATFWFSLSNGRRMIICIMHHGGRSVCRHFGFWYEGHHKFNGWVGLRLCNVFWGRLRRSFWWCVRRMRGRL